MNKYKVTREDLAEHLKDQIKFIIDSSISFDKGSEGEAKRLSTTIRVLLHDTTRSSSLLTQLNRMNILFYDSANPFDPNNLLPSNCLTMIRLAKKEGEDFGGDYVAPLENLSPHRSNDKKIGFVRWWNKNIVLKDIQGNIFHRKELILTVANQEGGTHVDPKLNQAYANLTRFNSIAWKVYTKYKKEDMGNPVPSTIRQIAHEVIKTLKEGVSDLFTDTSSLEYLYDNYEKHCLEFNKQRGLTNEEPPNIPTSS
jgi:hypothetical protein